MATNSRPPKSNSPVKDKDSQKSLWEIATPEEVATSIVVFYPDDPIAELDRREDYAREKEQTDNLRFWGEVRQLIKQTNEEK